jgi:beta-xylosidase
MDQGKSSVNGPHQGAWLNTPTGEDWFLHFQDKGAYGRVVHLQPMKWVNDWPVIGVDTDGDGKGEPVMLYKKPNVGKTYPIQTPAESDEFNGNTLGLQWQWSANPQAVWSFTDPARGCLRLFSVQMPDSSKSLWNAGNMLLQKFPADVFTATVKLNFKPNNTKIENERTGLVVMGMSYAGLVLNSKKDGIYLTRVECKDAVKGNIEKTTTLMKLSNGEIYFRVSVMSGARCTFSYSVDGNTFTEMGGEFSAEPGKWIGAKVGIFCSRASSINDAGYVDVDWFRVDNHN